MSDANPPQGLPLQTSRSFLTYLEKQAKIDEDNMTLLENLCQKIVPNLMEKLDKYKRERNEIKNQRLQAAFTLCKKSSVHCTTGKTVTVEESFDWFLDLKDPLVIASSLPGITEINGRSF